MPTEVTASAAQVSRHPLASRRILRLALGTALCLWYSQAVAWPLSFVAPILAMMILATPLPAMKLKQGIGFLIALTLPMVAGMALLPFLVFAKVAGILLLALALYHSFYFTAKGGSPILGSFITIGLTLVVTIGSVSPQVMTILVPSLTKSAFFALLFVWLAHALLPDPPRDGAMPSKPPAPPKPDLAEARRKALRSTLIVLPLALVFLFMSASPAYTVVMIQVSTLGQKTNIEDSRNMGLSLLASTFWGGLGAIIAWDVLRIYPSLTIYTLLIALAGLVYGRRIFDGIGPHQDASKWSYAYLTMVVVLAPAVLDSPVSSSADAAFWTRLFLFVLIALYSTIAVAVFDAFWPAKKRMTER